MKRISLEAPLARGQTADVHEWGDGQVLKLFHDWFGLEAIEYEQRLARAVHASGVKSPAVGELILFEGRNGLIYEHAGGESMLEMFKSKPWKVLSYARMLAELHTQMHECVFDEEIPAQRTRLQNKINSTGALSPRLKTKLLNALDSLPDGNRVCHRDFHPANVLIAGNDVTIIDWIDATRGNPLADVARASIIALGSSESAQTPNLLLKLF